MVFGTYSVIFIRNRQEESGGEVGCICYEREMCRSGKRDELEERGLGDQYLEEQHSWWTKCTVLEMRTHFLMFRIRCDLSCPILRVKVI